MLNSTRRAKKRPAGRRPGRRPGQPETREAILVAARELFADKGVAGTTVRAVAARAGVDPSLVIHFFGSKDALFEAALQPPVEPAQVAALVDGPRSTVGERIVRIYVEHVFRERGSTIASLMRSATSDEEAAARLRIAVERGLLSAIQAVVPGEDTAVRAEMVGTMMMGLFFARRILRLEPLASLDDEALIAHYAPLVQGLLAPRRGSR